MSDRKNHAKASTWNSAAVLQETLSRPKTATKTSTANAFTAARRRMTSLATTPEKSTSIAKIANGRSATGRTRVATNWDSMETGEFGASSGVFGRIVKPVQVAFRLTAPLERRIVRK